MYIIYNEFFLAKVIFLTSEHTLVDDTVAADEDGIALHDTAVSWDLNDITRHEQIGRKVHVICTRGER